MKRIFQFTLILLSFSVIAHAQSAKIDPTLVPFVQNGQPGSSATVLVLMDYLPTESSPPIYNRYEVFSYLKWQAQQAWLQVRDLLVRNPDVSAHIAPRSLFWLNQSFSAAVTPQGLAMIAQTPGVRKIYADYSVEASMPVGSHYVQPGLGLEMDYPFNFKMIGMDRVASETPQIDGRGVLVGVIDTGVDGRHPELQGKIGLFYDAASKQVTNPFDSHYHGTHVSGIIAGGRRDGQQIGVAPGATLLVAAGLSGGWETQIHAMEFMLNPDGDESTVDDIPRVINNSWTSSSAPDQEYFYRAISAWEAIGILPVFSAGNSGRQGERSITPPKEHPATLAVGALDPNALVADYSSRGPARYPDGRGGMIDVAKPDISAPGSSIRSTTPDNTYRESNGTSMASPHVAGAAALLYQVNPHLTPQEVKAILIQTSNLPDGRRADGTWDPGFGYGRLNVYEAIRAVYQQAEMYGMYGMRGVVPPQLAPQQSTPWSQTFVPSVREVLEFPRELEGRDWLTLQDLIRN